MADLETEIANNASGPKKVSGDEGSVEQHSLTDQIKADEYLRGATAGGKKHLGLRFRQLTPPGGTGK